MKPALRLGREQLILLMKGELFALALKTITD